MSTSEPAPSAVERWFLAPFRGGALAAGGALLGLGAALSLEQAGARSDLQLLFFLASTLVSVGIAIAFGFPGQQGGLRVAFERALGAMFYGTLIDAVAVGVLAVSLPRRADGPIAIAILGAVGVVLIVIARLSLPRTPRHEEALPDGPGGLIPAPAMGEVGARYALAATGPALTAEESERADPAVEIRILWGSDLLRAFHLSPPRAFHLGDAAGDFVIDGEALGASHFPLVRVQREDVIVTAPRGAAGTIQEDATTKRITLDHALAEGLARPNDDVPSAATIPLVPGRRVTISLPSRAAATAYRAAHGAEDAAEARIVIEVALVRAGRVVGRDLSIGNHGRFLVSTGVAAIALIGGLQWLTATMPVPDPDDEPIPRDQVYEIQQHFARIHQRIDALEEADAAPDAPWDWRRQYEASGSPVRVRPYTRLSDLDLEYRAFLQAPEIDMLGVPVFCWSYDWDIDMLGIQRNFNSAIAALCTYPQLTPFGLRTIGVPAGRDALGRDPSDLWVVRYEQERRRLHVPAGLGASGKVTITPLHGNAPAPMMREVRRRIHDLRACYALGLAEHPSLAGTVDIAFSIGIDGVAHTRDDASTLPDHHVARCAAGALAGQLVAPPTEVVHTSLRLRFAPSSR